MATARAVNVLIAEDDPQLRNLAQRAFERVGFIVSQASTGAELTQLLDLGHPDIIVLDVGLPDGDGRDLLALLKKDPKTAAIPVVVWSGRDTELERRVALDLGAEDFVEKGVPSALVAKVERVLFRVRES